ncbi:serine hydrolase domain-containing protein [Catenuloplanes atrovinosus]|uniref:CubicO group peptidase (Beta-lactamase class C family) n=1 Tax=Catenuloplanes atrovinosus TaxID=137266 RepID=A0AAE3YN84_9ACTN|nr:serine hydrolase domain-containing protein [Catenuloplanes atrovinosus]MDR7276919.1 CubicO group peptidase (beta-lactamase class C family) [Catenuloplanes atrovinosus]
MDDLVVPAEFSGVVSVDRAGEPSLRRAYGLANRADERPNRVDTRFAIASGSKGFVAVAALSLIESGELRRDTTARSLLGADLPLIAADVTVEHLLAHRSGIGDYLDEYENENDDVTAHVLSEPVHRLDRTDAFLPMLDGLPTVFGAGERFRYCNGGYVVLALILERASGVPFHDLIDARVFRPAGMAGTAYLRSDELPSNTAVGYLYRDGPRSNVLHLPVRGNGDGGAYSTAADISTFWRALFGGVLVSPASVAELVRPHTARADGDFGYGLGFWLRPDGRIQLEGQDAGVSFRSVHDPATATTWTVLCNWSDGAWPVARAIIT